MTDEVIAAAITPIIGQYRDRLRLHAWDIRYNPEWAPEDKENTLAYVNLDKAYGIASVHVNPEAEGDAIRFHIAHELAHLQLRDLYTMLGETAARCGPGGEAIIDWLEVETERVCNVIAHALTGIVYVPSTAKERLDFAPWAA